MSVTLTVLVLPNMAEAYNELKSVHTVLQMMYDYVRLYSPPKSSSLIRKDRTVIERPFLQ
jgi:hypothetical protein